MRTTLMHSVLAAALLVFAGAVPTYAADNTAMVICKDGTQSKSGKGACSHHGGIAKTGSAATDSSATSTTTTTSKPSKHKTTSESATSAGGAADTDTAKSKHESTSNAANSTGAASTNANSGSPTAKCKDGSMSYSKHHQGACSKHGGVAQWLDQ